MAEKKLKQLNLDLGTMPKIRKEDDNLGPDGKKTGNDWQKGGKGTNNTPDTKGAAKKSWSDDY